VGLAHAQLIPEVPPGDAIELQYNPEQYTVEKGVHLAEIGVPGLSVPVLQYVRGTGRRVSMQLFFDAFEARKDVRDRINPLVGLLDISSSRHVPAICRLRWGAGRWDSRGDNSFRCVLERASTRFTLFLEDGTPVRATVDVVLREHVDVEDAVRRDSLQSSDHDRTIVVRDGDTLSGIAARFYGDPLQWRPIAQANGIANPRRLRSGTTLLIPALRTSVNPEQQAAL
jgi:hypothetical protein